MLYALALQDRWPSLPEDFLSAPHGPIDLPPLGHQLMVEPFIHVARSASAPFAFACVAAAFHFLAVSSAALWWYQTVSSVSGDRWA